MTINKEEAKVDKEEVKAPKLYKPKIVLTKEQIASREQAHAIKVALGGK